MWHIMLDIEAVAFGDRRVDGGAGGGREVAVTVCSTYGGSPSILTSSS